MEPLTPTTYLIGYPRPGSTNELPPGQGVESPTISVLDSAAERGDGVFETFGVAGSRAQALDEHLDRLAHSAAMLDLPEPDRPTLLALVRAAAARVPAELEGSLKLVLTRGVRGGLNGWIVLSPSPDYRPVREHGIAVITLPVGYASDFPGTAPWRLLGAKTLSYATNMAATRAAERAGADDAIFVTTDGVLLEGPTSNLVVRVGDELVTPDPALGILHGTTQRAAFAFADGEFRTRYGRLDVPQVLGADGAWLLSSVRLAAPLTAIDGAALRVDDALTKRLNAALRART